MNNPVEVVIHYTNGFCETYRNPEQFSCDRQDGLLTFFYKDSFVRIPLTNIMKILANSVPADDASAIPPIGPVLK